MCKYHNRLFIFTLLLSIALLPSYAKGRPPDKKKSIFGFFDYNDDYDLHFDQRQNGTENIRISLDGVMVAVPYEALFEPAERLIDELEIAQLVANKKDVGKKYESRNSYKVYPLKDASHIINPNSKDDHSNENVQDLKDKNQSVKVLLNHGKSELQHEDDLKIKKVQDEIIDDKSNNFKQSEAAAIEFNYYKPAPAVPLLTDKNYRADKKPRSKYRFMNLLKLFRQYPTYE